jgi:hypothetical protein
LRNEFSFDKILNNDIIFVIEDMLYPDNSYLIYLKNKYINSGFNIINALFEFKDEGSKQMYIHLTQESTIQELINAFCYVNGLYFGDYSLLFNSRPLYRDDKRKIKEIGINNNAKILVISHRNIVSGIPLLGKTILAKGLITFHIGTLNPIKSLFSYLAYNSIKKIFIGKFELKPEDDNCLAFYGIREDFEFSVGK